MTELSGGEQMARPVFTDLREKSFQERMQSYEIKLGMGRERQSKMTAMLSNGLLQEGQEASSFYVPINLQS
jgi:hypothetical protein